MDTLWFTPALICYALASAGFIADRALGRSRWTGYAAALFGLGAVFHALDLAARGFQAGNIPVTNFPQSLSFLAWLTALFSLVLIVRFRIHVIGAFAAPGVTIAAGAAYHMMSRQLVLPAALRSIWLPIHVSLAFFGEALFVVAAIVSIVYLVFESRLKSKRPLITPGGQVVSLEKLDRMNYQLLAYGLILMTFAILTGAIWADATWGHFWSWEPRESWSLLTWILYAGLLESRATVGWRGRRAAALTIVVFTVLVGSFVGISLVYPGKHGGSFG